MNIALIGSGNTFFKDEGIGLYVVKYIKENYTLSDNVTIIDGGTLGFKLMPLLLEYDDVIIVNTASDDTLNAGDIIVKDTDAFINGSLIKKTANEVEIAEMLQICSLTENMAEVSVISIVPEDIISVEVALCDVIAKSFDTFVEKVLETLHVKGVIITKKECGCSLDEILYMFANPSIAEQRGF